MPVTKAIVLAAGVGNRLRPLTDERPKCLLDVGDRSILDRQLDELNQCGVTDVVIVVGYRAEQIRTHCQSRVRYLVNDRYADTNSLYSLWLARQELTSGAMILNSDVVVPRLLFERLLAAPAPDAILVEVGESFEPEDMKVRLDGRRVIDFGKDLLPAHSNAHNVGVAKFSADGAVHLVECVERLVADGRVHDWAPAAFREFAVSWPLVAVDTAGLPWIEIDFVEDLIRARTEVDTDILKLECAVPA